MNKSDNQKLEREYYHDISKANLYLRRARAKHEKLTPSSKARADIARYVSEVCRIYVRDISGEPLLNENGTNIVVAPQSLNQFKHCFKITPRIDGAYVDTFRRRKSDKKKPEVSK